MYFLTPRKCAIFGVCCEAIPRQVGGITTMHVNTCSLLALPLQVNYLIDEAVNTGKGANNIISMLHHFLETHNLGEANLHLHADNCSGQNKNRFVMESDGLSKKITLSFLVVDHTKFSPDWCSGCLNKPSDGPRLGVSTTLPKWLRNLLLSTMHSQLEHKMVKSWYQLTTGHNFLRPFQTVSPQRYQGHASFDILSPQTRHSDSQGFGDRSREIDLLKDGSWKPTRSVLPSFLRQNSHSNGNSISTTKSENFALPNARILSVQSQVKPNTLLLHCLKEGAGNKQTQRFFMLLLYVCMYVCIILAAYLRFVR